MRLRIFIYCLHVLSFTVFSFCPVLGQEKFEKEYQVDVSQVPADIADFISSFDFEKKVKWYVEESQIGQTFEAKTCLNKTKFSFEFDGNGVLLDVEEKVKFKKLEEGVQKKMRDYLSTLFDYYKIHKIQKQWSGEEVSIRDYINNGFINQNLILNYEVVLMGKINDEHALYEVLFMNDFKAHQLHQIVENETDNLEF